MANSVLALVLGTVAVLLIPAVGVPSSTGSFPADAAARHALRRLSSAWPPCPRTIAAGAASAPRAARRRAGGRRPALLRRVAVGIPFQWQAPRAACRRSTTSRTDTVDSAGFQAVVPLRADAPNRLDCDAERRAAAAPGLSRPRARDAARAADAAFDRALAPRRMPAGRSSTPTRAGRIEATDTTFWFGFEDDVVIRLTPGGAARAWTCGRCRASAAATSAPTRVESAGISRHCRRAEIQSATTVVTASRASSSTVPSPRASDRRRDDVQRDRRAHRLRWPAPAPRPAERIALALHDQHRRGDRGQVRGAAPDPVFPVDAMDTRAR